MNDKKHIAIMDTSSISFLQNMAMNGVKSERVLKDYDLIIVPNWVLTEINDAPGRADYLNTLIDQGFPIYRIMEEDYSQLCDYEEGNLYKIIYASVSMLAPIKSYLRRYVEKNDPLDMEAYQTWIKKLYKEWPISGDILSNGRKRKKNAGEVSITILAIVLSCYYPNIQTLTIFSQDSDTYIFVRNAQSNLKFNFYERISIPIAFKSNDAILCQLYRQADIGMNDIFVYRKNERKLLYCKVQVDYSVILAQERISIDCFVRLIQDDSVFIVF